MRILVLGSGGREHALVWKLMQSPLVETLFAAPGNCGMEADGARLVPIDVQALDDIVRFARKEKIDLVVPGPELPLTLGVTDALRAAGIPSFGPDAYCARLEGSKSYAKAMMRKAGVPTAASSVVHSLQEGLAALDSMDCKGERVVVKADGLAAGKGVIVARSRKEAEEALAAMFSQRSFGSAGDTVVLEELLTGEEVSLLAFCDGHNAWPLPSAQDHKAAFDGDLGPNTGGMGAYSPCPRLVGDDVEHVADRTIRPIIRTLAEEGHPFVGILYAGLMLTESGPKVLEYNVRFGDPECQPLLMRLTSDLAEAMIACIEGKAPLLTLSEKVALGVVLAKEGYPGHYERGSRICGLDELAQIPEIKVFHSGTKKVGSDIVSDGGRILCVTGLGETLANARDLVYQALRGLSCEGSFFRKDIGAKGIRD
ncbi:MAG: phosphoribosylamine--glycine ligase [Desulfovibrionaceae bacterium]|nr:phosphoribosylamine--glycine ligase [Desulfovibrionaceae bacterium]